jgi:hypothetical protein
VSATGRGKAQSGGGGASAEDRDRAALTLDGQARDASSKRDGLQPKRLFVHLQACPQR